MYVIFALCVPAAVPFARRAPLATLVCSLLLWAFAPLLAALVGASTFANWPFNPFAWQLMFVFGMPCRLPPGSARLQDLANCALAGTMRVRRGGAVRGG